MQKEIPEIGNTYPGRNVRIGNIRTVRFKGHGQLRMRRDGIFIDAKKFLKFLQ
jgi:hypothetical protein